jgi:magnesium-transporting ATPase (P-type)
MWMLDLLECEPQCSQLAVQFTKVIFSFSHCVPEKKEKGKKFKKKTEGAIETEARKKEFLKVNEKTRERNTGTERIQYEKTTRRLEAKK